MSKFQSQIEKSAREDFLVFLLEKWRISSGEYLGDKFSFKDRPYLLPYVQDEHPFKAVLKSAQAGISEIHVAEALFRAIKERGNILYTMPAGEQMQQFVDARARNAVINNEYLEKFVTGALNLKKFSIARNSIYFRGVQKRRQIISIDVSKLYADELDEYEEGTANTLTKRLGAAKNPLRRYFSTPSFHGVGVSINYYGSEALKERGSDQRVWTIKCDRCGKWNEDLIWSENTLDLNFQNEKSAFYEPNIIVVCRYCKKSINRLSANAEWVAKITSNSDYCHGYHISKLFAPGANLNQIKLDLENPTKMQECWNSDLGLPFEPKGSRLDESNIDAARGVHQIHIKNYEAGNFAGVDIGAKIHVTVGNIDQETKKLKLISAIELDSWDDMPYLYNDFNLKDGTMVIDMNPDKKEAVAFQQGKDNVWLAYYSTPLENTKELYTKDEEEWVVGINRTLMMMYVSDSIVNKKIILPIDIRRIRDFYEHLKSPIKAQKEAMNGEMITFYPKTKNPDHYYHTLVYFLIANALKPHGVFFGLLKTMMR